MEILAFCEMTILDIRQSQGWAKYLEFVGWKSVRTNAGVNIEFKKLGRGTLVKVQRPKSLNADELEEIKKLCVEHKAIFIKLEPSLEQDLSLLKKAGYALSNAPLTPPTTIYIDLQKSENALWETISHSGKYSIKRAQRESTKIDCHKKPDDEILKKFFTLEKETGKTKKFFVQSFVDLKTKADAFGEECYVLFSYDGNGNLCGGNFYLGFNGNIWFIHGGTTEIGRKNKTGYELVWQSFLYFKKLGYTILDLEGKDDDRYPTFTKDWGGFSHFKEKFGGDIIEFPGPRILYLSGFLRFIARFNKRMPL